MSQSESCILAGFSCGQQDSSLEKSSLNCIFLLHGLEIIHGPFGISGSSIFALIESCVVFMSLTHSA